MALSDAKSIPIDNAVAVLETMIQALKAYRKKVILYNDLEADRATLCKVAIEASTNIRSGGTPIKVDLADVVDAALKSVPSAPAKRYVQASEVFSSTPKAMAPANLIETGICNVLTDDERISWQQAVKDSVAALGRGEYDRFRGRYSKGEMLRRLARNFVVFIHTKNLERGSLVSPAACKNYVDEQQRIVFDGSEVHSRNIAAKKQAYEEKAKAEAHQVLYGGADGRATHKR